MSIKEENTDGFRHQTQYHQSSGVRSPLDIVSIHQISKHMGAMGSNHLQHKCPPPPTRLSSIQTFQAKEGEQNPGGFQTFCNIPDPMPPLSGAFYQRLSLQEHADDMGNRGLHNGHESKSFLRHQDANIFNNFSKSDIDIQRRPTAMVKPLNNRSFEDELEDVTSTQTILTSSLENLLLDDPNLPFANEQAGTIKMRTTPQEAFARYEEEEIEKVKISKTGDKLPKKLGNRTASDVIEDISTMLADLTNELDSMISHEST